jgi:hypothetical protein
MSSFDDLITGDLQRFAASHDHPNAAANDVALRGHQPVGGQDSAALARRGVDLAAATLPGRALFADRVARIAAGSAAVVVALLDWSFALNPRAVIEPVWNIAGSLLVVAAVYGVARAAAARRYDRRVGALSAHAEPARVLGEIRSRVERLDGAAVATLMVGVIALLPVLAYFAGGQGDRSPISFEARPGAIVFTGDGFDDRRVAMTIAAVLTGLAVLVGVQVHRARGGIVALPGWVRVLASGWVAAAGVGATAVAAAAAVADVMLQSAGSPVPEVFSAMATALLSSWLALWLSRRDRSRLAAMTLSRS